MTAEQILLLFFGLPVSVLTLGMRRGLGIRGLLKVLGTALVVSGLGWFWMRVLGHPLAEEAGAGGTIVWTVVAYLSGSALVGSLGGALVRLQGHGTRSDANESEPGRTPRTPLPRVWAAAGLFSAVFVVLVSGLIGVELRRYGIVSPSGTSVVLGIARVDIFLLAPLGFLAGAFCASLLRPQTRIETESNK